MITPNNSIIGFDGKKALNNLTGIGNYSRFIINALSGRNPKTRFCLFAPKDKNQEARRNLRFLPNIDLILPPQGTIREWWRCFGMVSELKKRNIQLYHGMSNELPFGIHRSGIPSVVTVHDLIFLRYPHTFSLADRLILQVKVKYACRHADRIIAISEQTKQDIMKYYGIAEDKIEVIYQGCADRFYHRHTQSEIQDTIRKYNIPEKYIISVGTIEKRKNHKTILKALEALPEVHLVLVSKKTPLQAELEQQISEKGMSDRVHILNSVPNADLPILYQGAQLAIYLSFFEGFGIPVLEAMASAIPVITATGSCLEEVGGDACAYCAPFDSESLTQTIRQILSHPETSRDMIQKGQLQARKFSSESVAENMENFYSKMLKG